MEQLTRQYNRLISIRVPVLANLMKQSLSIRKSLNLVLLIACSKLIYVAQVNSAESSWDFPIVNDQMSPEALLDLSWLNEDVAGQSGPIMLSPDRTSFVKGNGDPIRFWAVNTGVASENIADIRSHARFLAKRGVNMVRYHGQVPTKIGTNSSIVDIDTSERERIWRLVSAMKNEGIYVTLSIYWPHRVQRDLIDEWGFSPGSKTISGLLYINTELQKAYKNWLYQILSVENPYTGIPLKHDPALSILQMQNEDSLLFWTLNDLSRNEALSLSKRFYRFLSIKYKTENSLLASWGSLPAKNPIGGIKDNWDAGVVAVSDIWHLTQDEANEFLGRRHDDEREFLTSLMHDWHEEVANYLRDDLGAVQLFNSGNWITASNERLDDLERYSYTPGDVIAQNRYVTSLHEGTYSHWAVAKGDVFLGDGVLGRPTSLPIAVRQPVNAPYIIPETLWVPPIQEQSEGPILMAAYQSLTGIDASYWYNTNEIQWRKPGSANGYLPSIGKWNIATPMTIGMFPAASLIFRNGLIEESEPAVVERRRLQELWRSVPAIPQPSSHNDQFGDYDDTGNAKAGGSRISPLTYLVGPVTVEFGSTEEDHIDSRLVSSIDLHAGTVRSLNRQLLWNWKDRYVEINAPGVQGLVGHFCKAGRFTLKDVSIECSSEYASLVVVPLKGRSIRGADSLLIQVGTTAKPKGWKEIDIQYKGKPAKEIVDHGGPPWKINRFIGKIEFTGSNFTVARSLDPNGLPIKDLVVRKTEKGVEVSLPQDSLYVIIR